MVADATKYEPISTAASSTTSAATNCTRSGSRRAAAHTVRNGRTSTAMVIVMVTRSVRREPQDVADAADGVDQPWLDHVDLAAQVGDVGLDDAGLAVEVVAPHLVQDLRLGHN